MDAVDSGPAETICTAWSLDARCVEIAVFALALAAWRFPDENGDPLGVRMDMPAPAGGRRGLKVGRQARGLDGAGAGRRTPTPPTCGRNCACCHASFRPGAAARQPAGLAPHAVKNDLATSSFDTLRDLLGRALATERPVHAMGTVPASYRTTAGTWRSTAKGLARWPGCLMGATTLVVTNVPYLGSGISSW
jgi:hypothetical protein